MAAGGQRAGRWTVSLVIPDASVILKWVLPDTSGEADQEAALRLRDAAVAGTVELVVPALWRYEVGNTLARRFPEQALEIMQLLDNFGLGKGMENDDWLTTAIRLTRDYTVTFYDASYHALALAHQGTFVTADRRYLNRAGKAGCVVLLAQWA